MEGARTPPMAAPPTATLPRGGRLALGSLGGGVKSKGKEVLAEEVVGSQGKRVLGWAVGIRG